MQFSAFVIMGIAVAFAQPSSQAKCTFTTFGDYTVFSIKAPHWDDSKVQGLCNSFYQDLEQGCYGRAQDWNCGNTVLPQPGCSGGQDWNCGGTNQPDPNGLFVMSFSTPSSGDHECKGDKVHSSWQAKTGDSTLSCTKGDV